MMMSLISCVAAWREVSVKNSGICPSLCSRSSQCSERLISQDNANSWLVWSCTIKDNGRRAATRFSPVLCDASCRIHICLTNCNALTTAIRNSLSKRGETCKIQLSETGYVFPVFCRPCWLKIWIMTVSKNNGNLARKLVYKYHKAHAQQKMRMTASKKSSLA